MCADVHENVRGSYSCAFTDVFFFQAEDGIRDVAVTGVQTCALPICLPPAPVLETHLAYLRREALIGGYEAQEEAQHRLDAVYAATARLVGGSGPDEAPPFENAPPPFDMALYAVPLAARDVILPSTPEY